MTTEKTVTMWYDRHSKNWVVQVLDSEKNQVGDAVYVYTKREAQLERSRIEREVNRNDERDDAAAGDLPL